MLISDVRGQLTSLQYFQNMHMTSGQCGRNVRLEQRSRLLFSEVSDVALYFVTWTFALVKFGHVVYSEISQQSGQKFKTKLRFRTIQILYSND